MGFETGFNAMGKPIPFFRKEAAYKLAKEMGVEKTEDRFSLINSVSVCLERDNPFEALKVAMKHLDLTGAYRLMAYLLTAEELV